MSRTTRTRTLPLLLALLLAVVPAAGADLGPNQHLIPELKVNESIETIAISGVLSLQPEWDGSVTTGIPFGSIVVHTADARTLIFDSDGNQLLSISDELSAKVPTPAGVEKPCTWVHQLPNDSRVYHHDNATFIFGKAGNLILTVINEHPPPVEDPIAINITSPAEGETVWIDVVPPRVAVVGEVHAPAGLHNVVVRSGTGEVSCGNRPEFACSVPVSAGENTITVVADTHGPLAEKTVNVTVRIGLPPPPAIAVSGRVTDTGGNPVPGALVRFESVFTLDDEPLAGTNVTGEDGGYLVDTPGYRQTVTVEKEGYSTLREEFIFENSTNTLDLELEPLPRAVPGFGPPIAALSLTVGLLLIGRRGW
ncbi:carboxypeptidase regulatory-like domain-containing protein [Methanoculleus sp. YWC-01]|uniref:Carboxypeptidase regulatory-like domain-containing protein n=1 Tax=Methanoculleus nereidis TaxID=2735141 RepID=A0ABU3YZA0_9EURY|nr:carboxypeptidase-like regulatory domain-containing protein [Methanoculleus sp. YWC-01]MDV4341895.1 carboxypeptidase regulatory-like domain-containing protein [Methanoculleus sp. YWC-01]